MLLTTPLKLPKQFQLNILLETSRKHIRKQLFQFTLNSITDAAMVILITTSTAISTFQEEVFVNFDFQFLLTASGTQTKPFAFTSRYCVRT